MCVCGRWDGGEWMDEEREKAIYIFAAGFVWYVGGSLLRGFGGGKLAFGHFFLLKIFFLLFLVAGF